MSKFTPGPWVAKYTHGEGWEVHVNENGSSVPIFCSVWIRFPSKNVDEKQAADMNLAADAPALLAALKDLLDSEWQDDDGTPRLEAARDKARALIAKHGGGA